MSSEETVDQCQQAERLKAQGRFNEAEAAYHIALDAAPRAAELWWALGDLYARMENFVGVERCCRKVLEENPDFIDAWLYLGMGLNRQGQLEKAESALQQALLLNPEHVEALYQLAIVQQLLGKLDASIENYQKVLISKPGDVPVLFNLNVLFQRQGRVEEAFNYAFEALQAAPEVLKYRRQFINLLHSLCPLEVTDAQLVEILRSFDQHGLDAAKLMKPCILLLGQNPDVQYSLANAGKKTLLLELCSGLLDRLSSNTLLRCVLLQTIIASPEFGVFLRELRYQLLNQVTDRRDVKETVSLEVDDRFAEALACQFFNTDYAAFVQPEEHASVEQLAARLNERVVQDKAIDQHDIKQLLVYCMYRPFSSLELAETLFEVEGRQLSTVMPHIIKRQWEDYQQEKRLQEKIDVLTPISTGVSTAVREQYEESPYPCWFSADHYEPESCCVVLKTMFPHFDVPDFGCETIDALVAGCGTGRHAIMTATRLAKSNVLAIDLSKASLAYAERKAQEAGVSNIHFAQADILELGSLGRQFHVIEAVGVLHHMQEPKAGLKVLSDMLVDGGIMQLGLYSVYGKRAVVVAREYIAELGFEATVDGIRAAREALLALNRDHPAFAVTRFRDFYALSECRDLLFHVQEHCLSIPDLAMMLDDCDLEFIGFSLANFDVQDRYRLQYPDDNKLSNLSNWDEFEQAYPDTFEEMYQFWCHKIN